MYKIVFDDRIDCEYYCDNCIYNREEVKQVSMFGAFYMITKLSIIYAGIAEYFDLLFSSERQKLLIRNPLIGPKTVVEQTCICEEALNNFAL